MSQRIKKNKIRKKRTFRRKVLFLFLITIPICAFEAMGSEMTYQFPLISLSILIAVNIWFYIDFKKEWLQIHQNYDIYIEYDKELDSILINDGIKEFCVPVNNIEEFGLDTEKEIDSCYTIKFKNETPFGKKIYFVPDKNTKEGQFITRWITNYIDKESLKRIYLRRQKRSLLKRKKN